MRILILISCLIFYSFDKFPLAEPTYNGIDQLAVLTDQWVIVSIVNLPEVMQKIDELSQGKFFPAVNEWEESKKRGRPNWTVYRNEVEHLRDQFITEARERAGEQALDDPSTFSVTSSQDPRYSSPQSPRRVTRYLLPLGQEEVPGSHEIHYTNEIYLELPFPLEQGKTYTISLKNGKSCTFLFDDKKTLSRAIKVNQLGYLPDLHHKYAYAGGYLQDFGPLDLSSYKTFSVINDKTGEEVLKGELKLREKNPIITKAGEEPFMTTGEDTYEIDLSPLQTPGHYFISIPGVGRSWTFEISSDVYGDAFYITARFLYQARAGMEIKAEYSAWPRPAGHTEPVYESEYLAFPPSFERPENYEPFDIIGATIDYTKKTEDAAGGWYDAADWDRNINHYTVVLDLLNAYSFDPKKFTDGQLHIPESGNKIPDILDEAEWGLRVWKKSQDPSGGIAGAVETWTHPPMHAKDIHYAYSERTAWASLIYAGSAARLSRLIRPFDPSLADSYLSSATRAFAYGEAPENKNKTFLIHAKEDRGKGNPYTYTYTLKEEKLIPFQTFARLELYLATQDETFLEEVPRLLTKALPPYVWPFSFTDFSPWLYIALFSPEMNGKIPLALKNKWLNHYLTPANELVGETQEQPYRFSWPRNKGYWLGWGHSTMTNHARALLIAYHLTKQEKYREAATKNVDYTLGNNPLGLSWITGIGSAYPISIQHGLSEEDGIPDPIPGIFIYGTTDGTPPQLKEWVWKGFMKPSLYNVPLWRRYFPHQHLNVPQNEFTIHETISGAIFSFAMLMPDHWMPSKELLDQKPRDKKKLFGYWMVP